MTPPSDRNEEFADPARRGFAVTRWSVVLAAAADGAARSEALARLCEIYWEPIYFFLRGQGRTPEEAMDATQGFLTTLLERGDIGSPSPDRGRFRSFLLGAVRNYLANEHRRGRALKRGGGVPALSLDFADAEDNFAREPADKRTPERLYERRWALATLDAVVMRLKRDYEADGKGELFARLRNHLVGERGEERYASIGADLGMTEGAVKVAVHRLRGRYRDALREEIQQTVSSPAQVDEELRHLIKALE